MLVKENESLACIHAGSVVTFTPEPIMLTCPEGLSTCPQASIPTLLSLRVFSNTTACESLPNWHTKSTAPLESLAAAGVTDYAASIFATQPEEQANTRVLLTEHIQH